MSGELGGKAEIKYGIDTIHSPTLDIFFTQDGLGCTLACFQIDAVCIMRAVLICVSLSLAQSVDHYLKSTM